MNDTLLLIAFSFSAGLIDAAVGGGGLIQVPGLFATLPNQLPATLLGTNKFSSVFGTALAGWRYARKVDMAWRLVIATAITAFVFSLGGAEIAGRVPKDWMRPLVLGLLVVMLLYTMHKKDFGALHRPQHIGRKEMLIALSIGGAIGFYDGFFGPGTGSFLIFLFIRFFGFDFLRATSAAKIVNLATNLAALIIFMPAGHVLYQFAIPMAVANMGGAMVGTRLALKGGTRIIRLLFIGLVVALIIKLTFDTFR
ncbi:TSUP family transporter [Burkholderiaceae bacterium DAT-1]|nr:TSUP family transporter [Burkholderiaceae bacterium DAT-1]